jgi:quercetin dioxygenase-like cupin family protein
MDGHVVRAGAGEPVTATRERDVFLLAARDELAVTESRFEEGEDGPPPHFHRHHSDAFHVLEGLLVFEIGGERVEAPPGTFVLVPAGIVHTFRNEGPGAARFLNFHAPSGGFHEYLRARREARTDEERAAAEALFDSVDV